MCKCTPEIKTPFCGKPGCEWPPSPEDAFYKAVSALHLEVDSSIANDIREKGKAAMGAAYHQGKADAQENLRRNILALFK